MCYCALTPSEKKWDTKEGKGKSMHDAYIVSTAVCQIGKGR